MIQVRILWKCDHNNFVVENTWDQILARNTGPTLRISYSAIVYKNDLIIWGGGVPSGCFSNIYRLKLSKSWT